MTFTRALATNNYGPYKFIVDGTTTANGTHSTIATALTSASSGDTIYIRDGTYTENISLKAGVNLVAAIGNERTPNVTIIGTCTMTTAGSVTISGIRLQTNGSFALAVTGSAASVVILENCYLNCTNATGITYTSSSGSSSIGLINCNGDVGTTGIAVFASSGAGSLSFSLGSFANSGGSSTANTMSDGTLAFQTNTFSTPITTSGTSRISAFNFNIGTATQNVTCLTVGGSVSSGLEYGLLLSGSASAISVGTGATLQINKVITSCTNTNQITGLGTISISDVTSRGTGKGINTTTQNLNGFLGGAVPVTTPGAYPYTTLATDYMILVDSSAARTITPMASPQAGIVYVIKDSVGSAATNNITITPSGKNIDGAASFVLSNNYASVTIIYNGTEWNCT